MNAAPPTKPKINYQSPGAHQKSQWITDAQPGGHWLVVVLILAIAITVLGGIGSFAAWYLGWW